MTDIVRVLRVLEYTGPRAWVEATLASRTVKDCKAVQAQGGPAHIREATLGRTVEVLTRPTPYTGNATGTKEASQAHSGRRFDHEERARLEREQFKIDREAVRARIDREQFNRNRKPEEWR